MYLELVQIKLSWVLEVIKLDLELGVLDQEDMVHAIPDAMGPDGIPVDLEVSDRVIRVAIP